MNEMNVAVKSRVEGSIKEAMTAMGMDLNDPNLMGTPYRIAKMWTDEVFSSLFKPIEELNTQMTLFPAPSNQEVVIKDIPFYSTCSHHFMPFFGKVEVSYAPDHNVIGLSKIPRVIKWFSKKPQMQENFTREIGEYLYNLIEPFYLKVRVYDTVHTCVSARGVELPASTDTVWDSREVEP